MTWARGRTPHTTHHLALDVPCAFGLVRLVKLPSQDVWYDSDVAYHIICFLFPRTCMHNSSDSKEVEIGFLLAWQLQHGQALTLCRAIGSALSRHLILEYLLPSISFDVVKSIGRWASEAFILFLRKHAQILASYCHPRQIRALHDASAALGRASRTIS